VGPGGGRKKIMRRRLKMNNYPSRLDKKYNDLNLTSLKGGFE